MRVPVGPSGAIVSYRSHESYRSYGTYGSHETHTDVSTAQFTSRKG
jgi:hypothetical protein